MALIQARLCGWHTAHPHTETLLRLSPEFKRPQTSAVKTTFESLYGHFISEASYSRPAIMRNPLRLYMKRNLAPARWNRNNALDGLLELSIFDYSNDIERALGPQSRKILSAGYEIDLEGSGTAFGNMTIGFDIPPPRVWQNEEKSKRAPMICYCVFLR